MMRLLSIGIISAVVAMAANPPGVVIVHQSKEMLEYIGSPPIAILPGGDSISSHDLFGPKSGQSTSGTLALMFSSDLRHWKIERIVLSHAGPAMYAFQYVDWQFDGPDIRAVSRTAFDDAAGGRIAIMTRIT